MNPLSCLIKQLAVDSTQLNQDDLNQLKSLGIPVEKTPQGYRLADHLELLTPEEIHHHLPTLATIPDIHPVLTSTNRHLMDHGADLPSGSVCLAELQTAGRGRRGRSWQANFAEDLMLSMQWTFHEPAEFLNGFSLAVGLGIAGSLEALNRGNVKVKWPNDILLDGKKLGGILIELSGNLKNKCRTIIGLGLNINGATRHIEQPWSAINPPGAEKISRNHLAAMMIESLTTCCRTYQEQGFAAFQPYWNSMDAALNQPVDPYLAGQPAPITGIARGVNHQGALLLQTATGLTSWNIGEISLRIQS